MSLYGGDVTVKGYALVNLDDKTIVGTGLLDVAKSDAKALNAAVTNYIDALKDKGRVDQNASADDYKVDENGNNTSVVDDEGNSEPEEPEEQTVSGAISDIKTSVNDGNTVYYLEVDGKYYYIKVTDCMDVLLMKKGDKVEITFEEADGNFIPAKAVTRK